MAENKDGCVKPVKGPITTASEAPSVAPVYQKGGSTMLAKVGKPALTPGPDLAGNVWKVWKPDQAF